MRSHYFLIKKLNFQRGGPLDPTQISANQVGFAWLGPAARGRTAAQLAALRLLSYIYIYYLCSNYHTANNFY